MNNIRIREQRQPALIAPDDDDVVKEPHNAKVHKLRPDFSGMSVLAAALFISDAQHEIPGANKNSFSREKSNDSKRVKMTTLQILEAARNLVEPSSISIELQDLRNAVRSLHAEEDRGNKRTRRRENLPPRKRTKFAKSLIEPQAARSGLCSSRISILQQLPKGRPLCQPPRLPKLQAGEVVRKRLLSKRSSQGLRKSKE